MSRKGKGSALAWLSFLNYIFNYKNSENNLALLL